MGRVRTLLLGAALVACAALVATWPAGRGTLVRHHISAEPAQLSFEPVTAVPHCADYYGTGDPPKEGHAALFIQLPTDDAVMYYVTELRFSAAHWLVEDVLLGEKLDTRHFTLHIYAVTARQLEQLMPGQPVEIMPMRLLDSMVVIRDNAPDTC